MPGRKRARNRCQARTASRVTAAKGWTMRFRYGGPADSLSLGFRKAVAASNERRDAFGLNDQTRPYTYPVNGIVMKTQAGVVPRLTVFLSYRSVEERLADLLKTYLAQDFIGLVEVFLASDTTSIPAGQRWLAEIIEGLQRAQFHIIICSGYSVSRPWINYEAGATGVRGILIVPLCHSGLRPASAARSAQRDPGRGHHRPRRLRQALHERRRTYRFDGARRRL